VIYTVLSKKKEIRAAHDLHSTVGNILERHYCNSLTAVNVKIVLKCLLF
jgi:hypothetical protein